MRLMVGRPMLLMKLIRLILVTHLSHVGLRKHLTVNGHHVFGIVCVLVHYDWLVVLLMEGTGRCETARIRAHCGGGLGAH